MGKAASSFPPDDMKTLSSLDQFLVSVGAVKKTVSSRKKTAWQINLANEFRYHKFTHMYMQCLINHHCPSIKYIDLMSLAVDVLNDIYEIQKVQVSK